MGDTREALEDLQVISASEFALLLDVSVRTVYRWIQEERLPAFRIGHVTRIRSEDAKAFLEQHRTNGGAP